MAALLWGTLALPLGGFLVLIFFGRRFPERVSAAIGAGSVGVAAVLAIIRAVSFLGSGTAAPVAHTLATWLPAGSLVVELSLWYDGLSLTMTLVVTVIGFLIHLFSVDYMHGDEGYHRYFAYLNLFVTSMLLLLLAGNLLVMFVGWELVGLCSFLLIGFWHKDPANARAARKAFIVTRIGDTGLAAGIALLFAGLGTLDIHAAGTIAGTVWPRGAGMATAVAALLLVGAVGKSAQRPLHVWLPDAMAGPTPVSALIHAATMVTAGVYLVARTHVLFELAPVVLQVVAGIGIATVLVAGLSALVQKDLKRTLAYSTISQIGYMFLALGVGAWGAAIFHLVTHAFFKALLFLGAGAVMHATHGEHDMMKLGGLRREIPVVFLCFLAGTVSLASVPLVTAGFYSKGWILESLWGYGGGQWLWVAAVAGAFVTAFYSFRMLGLVFFGPARSKVGHRPGLPIVLPLLLLAAGALLAGFLRTPGYLGGVALFPDLLSTTFGEHAEAGHAEEILPEVYATAAVLLGAGLSLFLYRKGRRSEKDQPGGVVGRLLSSGFGFDFIYERLFIRPYVWLTTIQQKDWVNLVFEYLLVRPYRFITTVNRRDVVNLAVRGVELANVGMHRLFSSLQTGKLRWYLLGVSLGGVLIFGLEVLL
jgi:NADH-quinone oxidoreductase subunit L